jgi:ACR3 family arsenite efflux pump ArsB
MQKNMGTIDRTMRILLAIAVALLWWSGQISGTLAIVLGVFAGVFVLTSMVSFCPLYAPFGLSTCKRN